MRLTAAERRDLPDSAFALPEYRMFPIHDPDHVKAGGARISQALHEGRITPAEYARAESRVLDAERRLDRVTWNEDDKEGGVIADIEGGRILVNWDANAQGPFLTSWVSRQELKLAAVGVSGMSNTAKLGAIGGVLAGTALLAWWLRPQGGYDAKKAAGAPNIGSHVQAQYRDGNWYGATLLNTNLADPDAVRWDPGTMPASNNPRTGTSSARAIRDGTPAGIPIGSHVSAQFKDGNWYGATLLKANLSDPDAVRWDPGTAAAIANPRTGTSPARAVQALPAPGQSGRIAGTDEPATTSAPPEEKSIWEKFIDDPIFQMWFGDKASGAPSHGGLRALAASLTPQQKAVVHAARAAGKSPVEALQAAGISPAQLAAAASR